MEKNDICTTSYLHKVNNALEMFANPEHCPYSSHECKICANAILCITPCFELYHSELDYRQKALENRYREIFNYY